MKIQERSSDRLYALGLLLAFAMFSVLTIAMGAKTYKNIIRQQDENFSLRASLTYVTGKLRSTDAVIRLESVGGTDVLELLQTVDGEELVTYIYCYDGSLYELFAFAESGFSLGQGQALVELDSLSFEADGEMLHVSASTTGGGAHRCAVYIPGGVQ